MLRYLKTASGKRNFEKHGDLRIDIYIDADWAGSRKIGDQYQGIVLIGGNLVTWRSKNQNGVSRSSAESECRFYGNRVCELIWLRILTNDFESY